jgi:hypothetical protein
VDRLRRLNGFRSGEAARPGDILALPALAGLQAGRLPLIASPLPARFLELGLLAPGRRWSTRGASFDGCGPCCGGSRGAAC